VTCASLGVAQGTSTAASAVTAAGPWLFTGIVLAAQTGIDYRRYKNGEMTET